MPSIDNLKAENAQNFERFSGEWPNNQEAARAWAEAKKSSVFAVSYRRLTSLQAWKSELLEARLPDFALSFFLEAQNDALLSHVTAKQGMYRLAFSSLRGCIENIYSCLYYKDHEIEYRQFLSSDHRVSFTELKSYFKKHPYLTGFSNSDVGLDLVSNEYATLSDVLHSQVVDLRMTEPGGFPSLWLKDASMLRSWSRRERNVLKGVNFLLLSLYFSDLRGTSKRNLRKVLSFLFDGSEKKRIKERFGVNLKF